MNTKKKKTGATKKVAPLDPKKIIVDEIKPITPIEAKEKRLDSIESEMIQAVNNMILKKLDSSNRSATILQKDIVAEYFKIKRIADTPAKRQDLYDRHQLDFEPIFRKAGWEVSYDKPGYNESYEASFEFRKKKVQVED